MAGTKRAAPNSAEGSSKGTKASRTTRSGGGGGAAKPSSKKAPSKAAKTGLSSKDFKSKALPLHVNLTHTPPTIQTQAETDAQVDADAIITDSEVKPSDVPVTGGDIGFIGNLTLVPSSFSTGSYGWKGSKRITVELQGGETDGDGKEKVQVQLSINATVVGSKPEKKAASKGKKAKADEEEEVSEEEAEDDE